MSICITFHINGSKREYATAVCNDIMSTDANTVVGMEHKFPALCFTYLYPHIHYSYSAVSGQLKLHTLRKIKYHLNALLLIQVHMSTNSTIPFGINVEAIQLLNNDGLVRRLKRTKPFKLV
jgi:hypothetical protein